MKRSKPPRRNNNRTRGSALITVTLIGLFVMLSAAALINHFATTEANAIADSLAKTRIYWASIGHINYALSRLRREGMCSGVCENDDDGTPDPTDNALRNRADNLRKFLFELNNDGDRRVWDFGEAYNFRIGSTVIDGLLPTPNNNDGWVRATIALDPVTGSPFAALNGIEQRIRGRLIVDVCVAAPCGAPNLSSSGANRIEALRRN